MKLKTVWPVNKDVHSMMFFLCMFICECYSSMAYSGKGEGFSTTRFPLFDGTGAGFLKYCDRDQ